MNEFIEVAPTAEVPLGAMRTYWVGDRRIVVVHTADGFFALDNTCPHRGGPLGEGDLLGDEVVCPWHLWSYDVRTGVNPGNPESIVATYEVRVEGDKILVRLSQPAPADESEAASQT